MRTDDEYRANAAECQRLADLVLSDSEWRYWADMARYWLSLIKEERSRETFDSPDRRQPQPFGHWNWPTSLLPLMISPNGCRQHQTRMA
jgi:hypothetical protein